MRGSVAKKIRGRAKELGRDYKKMKEEVKKIKRNPKFELPPKNLLLVHFNRSMPSAYKRPLKSYRHIMTLEKAKSIVAKIANKNAKDANDVNVDLAIWHNNERVAQVIYERPKDLKSA